VATWLLPALGSHFDAVRHFEPPPKCGTRAPPDSAKMADHCARLWGLGRDCAPSQKIYEFFISRWCDMVHSGCVVFKIHVSHGLSATCGIQKFRCREKIKHLSKYWGVVNTGRPLQAKYWGSRPLQLLGRPSVRPSVCPVFIVAGGQGCPQNFG